MSQDSGAAFPRVTAGFDRRLWEEVARSELGPLLEGLEAGWKRRLDEAGTREEEGLEP